jgi:glycosyltransferase involved in cell wall biosynthesis
MKESSVSIIIPVFNERESIPELIRMLEKIESDTWNIAEYVFVDDGSTDGSFDTIRAFRNKIKRKLTLIRFRKNLGKSAALSVGFQHANGDFFVTLDADLQDEPAEIPQLLQVLDKGSDVVVGWRKIRRDRAAKRYLSKLFNVVVSNVYHISLHDINSGLKAFRREVADEISLYGELHRFFPVLAAARGFKVTEVPVSHHRRQFGKSKYTSKRLTHAFFDLVSTLFLTSYEHEPMQIFGTAGGVGILIGLIILIYLSVLHFMGQSIIGRPLLFLGILFVLFGMQWVSAGLIGELIIHKQRHDIQNYPIGEIIT